MKNINIYVHAYASHTYTHARVSSLSLYRSLSLPQNRQEIKHDGISSIRKCLGFIIVYHTHTQSNKCYCISFVLIHGFAICRLPCHRIYSASTTPIHSIVCKRFRETECETNFRMHNSLWCMHAYEWEPTHTLIWFTRSPLWVSKRIKRNIGCVQE